jgi:hypothetical protein
MRMLQLRSQRRLLSNQNRDRNISTTLITSTLLRLVHSHEALEFLGHLLINDL